KEIFSSNSYLNDNSIKPMHFNKLPPYYKNCIG
ncbi:replication protein, partial [Escherichia coli]|nr:replication protein [Escherichia coli]